MVSLSGSRKDAAFLAAAACVCVAVGAVLPAAISTLSPGRLSLVPVGVALAVWTVWLSVRRPLAALTLGFALVGAVVVEPAPVDLVLALLIVSSYAVSHVSPRVPAFVALPLGAYGLVSLVSVLNATDTQRAVRFELITLYMLVLAVWLSWAFSDSRWVATAMRTYIIVAIVSAALAPIALYLPLPASVKSLLTFSGDRAKGLFKDPNVYAPFLGTAGVILLEELSEQRLLRWHRRTIAAAFALVSLGVAISYSRAGWLSYAIGISTLVVVQAARSGGLRRAARSLVMLAVGGAVGLLLLSATGSLSFFQQRSQIQTYDQQRFANQSAAFGDATRHVFGYGPGQSEVHLPLSTHETFVRAAYEQGLLGVAALGLVFVGTLLCALRLARRQRYVHGIGTAALLGIWLGQGINSFFVDTLHWRHLWIFAALIWCGYTLRPAAGRAR